MSKIIQILNDVAAWVPSIPSKMMPPGRRGKVSHFEGCCIEALAHAKRPAATSETDALTLLRALFISMPEPVCRMIPDKVMADYEALLAADFAAAEQAGEVTDAVEMVAKWRSENAARLDPRYPIAVWRGDMCKLRCGASMNPANQQLLGCFLPSHKCLDHLLHKFSGPKLRIECQKMKDSLKIDLDDNGQCRVTPAFQLPHQFVFHTCGPDLNEHQGRDHWVRDPTPVDQKELSDAYANCLRTASDMGLPSLAFCALSCGVFGYKTDAAVKVAFATVKNVLDELVAKKKHVPAIVFNVFAPQDHAIYLDAVFKPEFFGAGAGAGGAAPAAAAAAAAADSAEKKEDGATEKKDEEAK